MRDNEVKMVEDINNLQGILKKKDEDFSKIRNKYENKVQNV